MKGRGGRGEEEKKGGKETDKERCGGKGEKAGWKKIRKKKGGRGGGGAK